MVRAVIWDFGGVFTTSPFEAFARYERERGIPEGFIRKVNATDPDTNAWAQFERNQLSYDEFDAAFREESAALGHPIGGREVIALLAGDVRPEMVRALDLVRERLTCACITNNVAAGEGPGITFTAEKTRAVEAIMARFDLIVESSKEGVRKPDPRIYEIACERLGIAPEEAVYLDDLGINLKPARAMGMTTIKVEAPGPALDALEAAVSFPVR